MNMIDISLYGILDPEHCCDRELPALASIAADNGVTVLQYRDKSSDTRHMVAETRAILEALSGSGVALLVNDRADVALAAGADGVHLGQCDLEAADARRILGEEAIIGLSVKTEDDAGSADIWNIDYAFIGGVHATTSKDNPAAIGVEGWQRLAAVLRDAAPQMPIGAIAGITASNIAPIIAAGADGVAMIAALFEATDVAEACRQARAAIDAALVERSGGAP